VLTTPHAAVSTGSKTSVSASSRIKTPAGAHEPDRAPEAASAPVTGWSAGSSARTRDRFELIIEEGAVERPKTFTGRFWGEGNSSLKISMIF
jgi:hypothetical protein